MIAIILPNGLPFLISFLATTWARAIAAPLNSAYPLLPSPSPLSPPSLPSLSPSLSPSLPLSPLPSPLPSFSPPSLPSPPLPLLSPPLPSPPPSFIFPTFFFDMYFRYTLDEFVFYLDDIKAKVVVLAPGPHAGRDAAQKLKIPIWEMTQDSKDKKVS